MITDWRSNINMALKKLSANPGLGDWWALEIKHSTDSPDPHCLMYQSHVVPIPHRTYTTNKLVLCLQFIFIIHYYDKNIISLINS